MRLRGYRGLVVLAHLCAQIERHPQASMGTYELYTGPDYSAVWRLWSFLWGSLYRNLLERYSDDLVATPGQIRTLCDRMDYAASPEAVRRA
jgi:hypothetical protein